MGYIACAVIILLVVLASRALALPRAYPDESSLTHKYTECNANDATQTLCQRCAKQTKSNIVYPMCCEDLEEARSWCYHYVTFGIQGQ